jgi:hypothetical protein
MKPEEYQAVFLSGVLFFNGKRGSMSFSPNGGAAQHFVKDHAKRPDIGRGRHPLRAPAPATCGRDRSNCGSPGVWCGALASDPGQAEIHDFDLALSVTMMLEL